MQPPADTIPPSVPLTKATVSADARHESATADHKFPAAPGAQGLDSSERAVCYILSRPRFVDSGAVRQSIHEREGAYPVAQDYAELLEQGVLLFLTWQESFATPEGVNQLMIL
jgi:hypothetical protein